MKLIILLKSFMIYSQFIKAETKIVESIAILA